jgi:hypothetical protein
MPNVTRFQLGVVDQAGVAGPATTAGATTGATPLFTNTLTTATPHGAQAGDRITIAGVTPGAWNGTWTVAAVPSTTTLVILSATSFGTISVQGTTSLAAYLPATAPTPTRFFECRGEKIKTMRGRIRSQGMRAATSVLRADRQVPTNDGAGGDLPIEVLTKGFGFWLKYMLGSVATAGPTDSAYTHTATIGALEGQSFCAQVNRAHHPADVDDPFTFVGGKVTSWKLENQPGGLLLFTPTCDFVDAPNNIALASASYPSSADLLSFAGGQVTIGGVNFDVTNASVSCNNSLKIDRKYVRNDSRKKEPVQNAWRQIAWALAADWDTRAQYDRYCAALASGLLATIVLTWTGPNLIGVSSKPSLTVTIDQASFDDHQAFGGGPDPIGQILTGAGLFSSASALTVAYVTADSTP